MRCEFSSTLLHNVPTGIIHKIPNYPRSQLNISVNTGIVGDTQGNINGYSTFGGSVGTGAGVSVGVSAAVSNAVCNKNLSGTFGNVSGGAGFGPSASADVFWGPSDNGPVIGVAGTVGVGVGGGTSAGPSYTFIH
jgi:hypothetical protein